jgi:uncharacterized membrane protein
MARKNEGKKFVTIRITQETHKRLRELGKMGDTMDRVIERLLDSRKK